MSADAKPEPSKLSVRTLAVASTASMTAAIVIHEFWAYGAILGAAITPIIVAVTSELVRKPVDRAAQLLAAERVRDAAAARAGTVPTGPPAPDPATDDRFGIWGDDQREPWYRRLNRRHARMALITGLAAFAIGAVALTAAELVFGGSVGSGGKRTTLVPVGGNDGDREDRDGDTRPGTTDPATGEPRDDGDDGDQPAPQPGQTQPAPGTTQPAPTPTPTQPAPAPAPQQPPGGAPAPAPQPAPG